MTPTTLHFSLGPVQGFIGQARRIRDYWAGSFLLSYLTGRAMHALEEGGHGKVEFPELTADPLYAAIEGSRNGVESCACTEMIGTLPNRFKATVSDRSVFGPNGEDPCSRAVQAAWGEIAGAVWKEFVEPVAEAETRKIWDRQVKGFWEITWTLGPADKADGGWLDRRKNWRTHWPAEEPGDHCRMMGDYQELSGWLRAHKEEREKQEAFWDALRVRISDVIYAQDPKAKRTKRDYDLLELRRTERLCAMALIKRLFPILPSAQLKKVIGWIPDGPRGDGDLKKPGRIRYWPSTAYIAAAPWMLRAFQDDEASCRRFADQCRNEVWVEAVAERESRVRSLAGDPALPVRNDPVQRFGVLDGRLFYPDVLDTEIRNARRERREAHNIADAVRRSQVVDRAEREIGRKTEVMQHLAAFRRELVERWSKLPRTRRQRTRDDPSPFYALLLMDGDGAGKLIGELGGQPVSRALGRFTQEVQKIVPAHDGVLIYAGGDDVKAFLKLDRMIGCVLALHAAYLEAWSRELDRKDPAATISAGLVVAHHNVPLSAVIREAHEQLDKLAKEENGRNSLAVTVLKPSGKAISWVSGFERRLAGDAAERGPIARLMELAERYAREPERSTSFLYKVRERYGDLLADQEEHRDEILLAEWLKGKTVADEPDAAAKVGQLVEVCSTVRWKPQETRWNLDGGMLARFLAEHVIAPEAGGADEEA